MNNVNYHPSWEEAYRHLTRPSAHTCVCTCTRIGNFHFFLPHSTPLMQCTAWDDNTLQTAYFLCWCSIFEARWAEKAVRTPIWEDHFRSPSGICPSKQRGGESVSRCWWILPIVGRCQCFVWDTAWHADWRGGNLIKKEMKTKEMKRKEKERKHTKEKKRKEMKRKEMKRPALKSTRQHFCLSGWRHSNVRNPTPIWSISGRRTYDVRSTSVLAMGRRPSASCG